MKKRIYYFIFSGFLLILFLWREFEVYGLLIDGFSQLFQNVPTTEWFDNKKTEIWSVFIASLFRTIVAVAASFSLPWLFIYPRQRNDRRSKGCHYLFWLTSLLLMCVVLYILRGNISFIVWAFSTPTYYLPTGNNSWIPNDGIGNGTISIWNTVVQYTESILFNIGQLIVSLIPCFTLPELIIRKWEEKRI